MYILHHSTHFIKRLLILLGQSVSQNSLRMMIYGFLSHKLIQLENVVLKRETQIEMRRKIFFLQLSMQHESKRGFAGDIAKDLAREPWKEDFPR